MVKEIQQMPVYDLGGGGMIFDPQINNQEVPVPVTPVIIEAPATSLPQELVKQPAIAPIAQVSEPISLPIENLGSSIVNPNPIDTLPAKAPIELVKEPIPSVTPIVNIPTTEPIAKEPITVPKEETTSNIAPAPVDTVAKTTLNIIPLMMPNLSPASGGASDANSQATKTNPTHWLYVLAGAVVLGYLLMKNKSTQN